MPQHQAISAISASAATPVGRTAIPSPAQSQSQPQAQAADRAAPADRRIVCMVVRQLTAELLGVVGDRQEVRRARRRASCHVRQIAMYVCHVALSMSYGEIAEAFGLDRTTVSHACHVVEDRRDDAAFDTFVSTVERLAESVCMVAGRPA
ncbi:helix-turn-helix domain-containing protein [Ciceribacter selenitireducens]|uniref:helix-turn-helix domain-containing protein n=1 Tax=Ciceribacter selenitireducens TaxID=448181 RepID=UPI000E200539|nr:helix-turn-helix domain-containing protein [Ciceribacter selenitireducens]